MHRNHPLRHRRTLQVRHKIAWPLDKRYEVNQNLKCIIYHTIVARTESKIFICVFFYSAIALRIMSAVPHCDAMDIIIIA